MKLKQMVTAMGFSMVIGSAYAVVSVDNTAKETAKNEIHATHASKEASVNAGAKKIANKTDKTASKEKGVKTSKVDPEMMKHGKQVFSETCTGCHGINGEGGVGPKLTGRSAEYIKDKLTRYKKGLINTPISGIMTPVAYNLSEKDIKALSVYISETFK